MLFMFVCFVACPSVYLKIDCNHHDGTWKNALFTDLPYKREKLADGDESFYVKGHFVGFIQKNSRGIVTGFGMRVGGNLPGDYFLTAGYALGWVSYKDAIEFRDAANAIDFGLTGLAPKWWRSGYVEKNHTFEIEFITEDLFKRRIRWLYKLNTHKIHFGSLWILTISEAERDREKAKAVKEHLDGFKEFSKKAGEVYDEVYDELIDDCSIQ